MEELRRKAAATLIARSHADDFGQDQEMGAVLADGLAQPPAAAADELLHYFFPEPELGFRCPEAKGFVIGEVLDGEGQARKGPADGLLRRLGFSCLLVGSQLVNLDGGDAFDAQRSLEPDHRVRRLGGIPDEKVRN